MSALALSAGLCSASFAQVTGTVKLNGPAPERKPVPGLSAVPACAAMHKTPVLEETIVADKEGHLANVVVSLRGDKVKGDAPKEPAILDQKGCQYVPHVIDMTVGQELLAKNEDPFLHNVHTLPENTEPTNIAQPSVDKVGTKLKPVKAAEVFKVKCDVHPWMAAWVAAFDHPYHSVTGDDGVYSIDTKGLPDGDYEILFWQEKLAREPKVMKVTIKGGKGTADCTIDAPKASADGKTLDGAQAASCDTGDGKTCCSPTSKAKLMAASLNK
jgi:hypothetical protein